MFAGPRLPLIGSIDFDSSCAPSGGAPKMLDAEDSVVQNHIEQRFMNPDATVRPFYSMKPSLRKRFMK